MFTGNLICCETSFDSYKSTIPLSLLETSLHVQSVSTTQQIVVVVVELRNKNREKMNWHRKVVDVCVSTQSTSNPFQVISSADCF